MKISEEYKKEELLEFRTAATWMVEGAEMLLELIEKEETGQEVTRVEKIEAKTMINKATIAMEEFNKAKREEQVNNMNRSQKRNFKKRGR